MALFGRRKEEAVAEPVINKEAVAKKLVIGVNPELVNRVKEKVGKLREEKETLKKDYFELINRMSIVEGKCDAIDSTFKNFKDELKKELLSDAMKTFKRDIKTQLDSISNNHVRIMKVEDELIKISKDVEGSSFMSSFQSYYQLIKLCIYQITNAEPASHSLISLMLQTIHSVVEDMIRNGYWDTGKEAIITSLLNLKTYWRGKDERVEALIGSEINALNILR